MTNFRKADFEPHITSTFEVTPLGMAPVPVELVEINEIDSASIDGFTLMFRGGTETVFRHDTHTVRHPVMGELELFLGPVHTGHTDAVYYQAVFSTPRLGR